MLKRYSFICFLILFLGGTACNGSSNNDESPANETDALGRVKLGNTVSDNGYSMVVNELVDPATPLASYNQSPNERVIAVHATFKNDSNETPLFVTLRSTTLLASNGIVYGTPTMLVEDELTDAELAPGEEISGWIGFEIPAEERPLVFTFLTQAVELESRLSE